MLNEFAVTIPHCNLLFETDPLQFFISDIYFELLYERWIDASGILHISNSNVNFISYSLNNINIIVHCDKLSQEISAGPTKKII